MSQELAKIRAASRQEALDWSLVLASQAIDSQLDLSEEGWGLWVSPGEQAAAVRAIELYRRENAGWPWQREIGQPGVLFDWGSLAWAALLVLFFIFDARNGLSGAGAIDSAAVWRGEWWRLSTATWLHRDLGHLAANAVLGVGLLGLVMGRLGTGVGLLAAAMTGVCGNLLACLLYPANHRSLGASGVVLGCVGLLAAQSPAAWRRHPGARRYIVAGLAAGLMLFVFLGLSPGTDVTAHFGGFGSGVLIGALLSSGRRRSRHAVTNLICGFLFVVLVTATWWMALSRYNAGQS